MSNPISWPAESPGASDPTARCSSSSTRWPLHESTRAARRTPAASTLTPSPGRGPMAAAPRGHRSTDREGCGMDDREPFADSTPEISTVGSAMRGPGLSGLGVGTGVVGFVAVGQQRLEHGTEDLTLHFRTIIVAGGDPQLGLDDLVLANVGEFRQSLFQLVQESALIRRAGSVLRLRAIRPRTRGGRRGLAPRAHAVGLRARLRG